MAGDRRPFTVQILASPVVPDLTVVATVYLFVRRASGALETWVCTLASQTASQILATYAPVAGNDDTPGEQIHLRPYLTFASGPDCPCADFEIQVVSK